MEDEESKKKKKIFHYNEYDFANFGSGALTGNPNPSDYATIDHVSLAGSAYMGLNTPDLVYTGLDPNICTTSAVNSYSPNGGVSILHPGGSNRIGIGENGEAMLYATGRPFLTQNPSVLDLSSMTPISNTLSKEEAEDLIAKYDVEHKNRQNESSNKLNEIAKEVNTIKKDLKEMFSHEASEHIKKLVELEVRRYFIQREKEIENISYSSSKAMIRRNRDFIKPSSTKKGLKKRNVTFNKETGKIFYRGKCLAQLTPGQIHYKFFECLFDSAECAVSYGMLKQTVLGKDKDKRSKTDNNYCQSKRTEIKKKSKVLAGLIKTFSTGDEQRGYKLNCS